MLRLRQKPISEEEFFRKSGENDVLLFIHGYNVAFHEAILRTGQLAYDLKFSGHAMLYSWPSKGELSDYMADEDSAIYTAPHLRSVLIRLTQVKDRNVYVLAHSMGNRPLIMALEDLGEHSKGRIKEAVFAAPDVNAAIFAQAAGYMRPAANRFTLYASATDKALAASRKLHSFRRAGDTAGQVTVVDGVDTVDVTPVDKGFFSLNHSYYGGSPEMITELRELFQGLDASKRRLLQQVSGRGYWKIKNCSWRPIDDMVVGTAPCG